MNEKYKQCNAMQCPNAMSDCDLVVNMNNVVMHGQKRMQRRDRVKSDHGHGPSSGRKFFFSISDFFKL